MRSEEYYSGSFYSILMHINSHGVLHFIGILMIMSGLTAFLISQLAKYGIVMHPGESVL